MGVYELECGREYSCTRQCYNNGVKKKSREEGKDAQIRGMRRLIDEEVIGLCGGGKPSDRKCKSVVEKKAGYLCGGCVA